MVPHPPVAFGNANKDQNSAGKQQENPAVQGRESAAPKTTGLLESSLHFVVLHVVPVKVTGIVCEKPVITYALLGNGSN